MKHSILSSGQAFRATAVALSILLWAGIPAVAQVSIGISTPGVSIGINMPVYPQFVRVPNYPVYYAPRLQANLFFYDGMYWVYQQDNWYTSTWYNGPWWLVNPQAVPLYVLRIPVRYYRNPPPYFGGWRPDAPPRWGDHWGNQWSQQRSGWDRWDRRAAPAPAPLPVYQRQYSGDRYPHVEQQQVLQSRNYRYQPRDTVVRQYYRQQVAPAAVAPRQGMPQAAPAAVAPPPRVQQAAPTRAPEHQGRPALQGRPQQPEQPQQRAEQPPRSAERRQPVAPGATDRGQPPAARVATPAPEQAQRQGPAQGQGRAADKAKGREQDRGDREKDKDRDKDEKGRQGKN